MHKLLGWHGPLTSPKSGTNCSTRPTRSLLRFIRQSLSLTRAGEAPDAIRQAVHADLHAMHQLCQDGNIGWSLRQLQYNQVQTWHYQERSTHTTEQRIDLVCVNGAHGGILQTHAHHLPQAELELDVATVLVSSRDAKVDGFTCGWHVESELQVMALAVSRDRRQRGIGRALLEQLLLTGRRLGDESAFLEFREGNEAAMSLYLSAGFEQVGRRRNYYENGDAAILMRKAL